MSSFKEKLKVLYAQNFCKDIDIMRYNQSKRSEPSIKQHYAYIKFQSTVGSLTKRSLPKRESPTKLLEAFKESRSYRPKELQTNFLSPKYLKSTSSVTNHLLLRSNSSINLDLRRNNNRIKNEIMFTKNSLEYNPNSNRDYYSIIQNKNKPYIQKVDFNNARRALRRNYSTTSLNNRSFGLDNIYSTSNLRFNNTMKGTGDKYMFRSNSFLK